MSTAPEQIRHISGRGMPLRGNDMDTEYLLGQLRDSNFCTRLPYPSQQ